MPSVRYPACFLLAIAVAIRLTNVPRLGDFGRGVISELLVMMSRHDSAVLRSTLWCETLVGFAFSMSLGVILHGAEPLISRGEAGWKYTDAPAVHVGVSLDDRWTQVEFDDQDWPEGQAILGYGDTDIATELSFGQHPQHKASSALFRKRFRIAGRSRFRLLRGRICCDDGAVVFVNGREVYRYNMPSGRVTQATRAVRALGPELEHERHCQPFSVPTESVVDGENVVAVSVHQANATSSDLAMDLELSALTSEEEVDEWQDELKAQVQTQTVSPLNPVVRFKISGD